MIESPINIVIVDDHAPFRSGIVSMLRTEKDLVVVGQGASATEAIDLANALQPHLVILDLDMPGGGLLAAATIAKTVPNIKIVMLTISLEERLVQTLQQIGVHGYLIKGITARGLSKALRAIYGGAQLWPSFNAVSL